MSSRVIKDNEAVSYSMPSLEEVKISGGGRIIIGNTEKIQRKAYEEGFAAGEKAGFKEGEHKCLLLEERLKNILDEIIVFKEKIAEELESNVVELAVAVAKKVIIEEIKMEPEIILTMVKNSLRKMNKVGTISIKINPALHDLFVQNKSGLIDIHPDIHIDLDPNIPVSGPHVSSRTEEVITDIETLLDNIMEEMKNEKQNQGTPSDSAGPGTKTEENDESL